MARVRKENSVNDLFMTEINNLPAEEVAKSIGTDDVSVDISTLSHEELLAMLKEQQQIIADLKSKLDDLLNPPPNDWHAWFYALLNIIFHKVPTVRIQREVLLGVQSPRADFVVIVEDEQTNLELQIFAIFKKYNIIEFKSPDDALNMFTLWKGIGYVSFYLNDIKEKGEEIDISEVTLSFFRETKPVKLFQELGECLVNGPAKGIYYIKNWIVGIPIQIIVTGELKGEEYAGFRAISRKPKEKDVASFLRENGDDKEIVSFLKAYTDGVSRIDGDLIEEMKGRYPEMGKTLMEIMKPELDAAIAEGREVGHYSTIVSQVRRNDGIFTDEQITAFMQISTKTLKIIRFLITKHPDWKDENLAEEVMDLEKRNFNVDEAYADEAYVDDSAHNIKN